MNCETYIVKCRQIIAEFNNNNSITLLIELLLLNYFFGPTLHLAILMFTNSYYNLDHFTITTLI